MRTAIAFLLVLVAAGPCAAQRTPEMVAQLYLDNIRAGAWGDIADLIHPTSAAGLKEALVERIERLPDSSLFAPGVENTVLNLRTDILAELGVTEIDEVRPREPVELTRWLLSRTGNREGSQLHFLTGIEGHTVSEIVGVLYEDAETAHVLRRVRLTASQENERLASRDDWQNGVRMDVITLRRAGEEWRIWKDSGIPLVLAVSSFITYKARGR